MTKAIKERIGHKNLKALAEETGQSESIIWDTVIPGFGARRQMTDAITFFLRYRTLAGRQRRYTIGRYGPFLPDSAREIARQAAAAVALGKDPAAEKQAARKAMSMADLCEQYWSAMEAGQVLTRQGAAKKPLTMASDKGRIYGHIIPFLGTLPAASVTSQDVIKLRNAVAEGATARRQKSGKARGVSSVRGGTGAATKTVSLLGAIFSFAVQQGIVTDNPVRGIPKQADKKRERRVSDLEYPKLAQALRLAEEEAKIWPAAVQVTRFLLLTGWRRGEALGLRWRDVNLTTRTATLADSKTGKSIRPLSQAACDVLKAAGRGLDGALIFPPSRGDTALDLKKPWRLIMAKGDIPEDVTPHVLRHSFVSVAADIQLAEPTIAALVGHKRHTTTSRYTHSADAVLLAAADQVAEEIARRMAVQTITDTAAAA